MVSLYHCSGSTKFAISASILYDLLVLKFPWIGLNVRFIVLQTVFLAELEEVTIQLFISKCVPILLYGLEACALNKHQIASLDFVINRFL